MKALLEKHGDFKIVECKLSRWQTTRHKTNLGGRWCTKEYLQRECHYTKPMIENSFKHAKAKGLWRKNEVHGEEEAKLVIDDGFSHENENGEGTNFEASGEIEAGFCSTWVL